MILADLSRDESAIEDEQDPRDQGMTLIEVLVAMGLFAVLSTLLLGLSISTNQVTEDTRDRTGVTEEARTAMERMAREVRQSSGITDVTLPTLTTDITSFTFWTDFNGDGLVTNDAADPEKLTYAWNPTTHRLTLTAQTGQSEETRPLLAAKVTSFVIGLDSSEWAYDANGDGVTTWEELDARPAPLGNQNSAPDAAELDHVDLLDVSMTVEDGKGTQTYRTQIDLRNRD